MIRCPGSRSVNGEDLGGCRGQSNCSHRIKFINILDGCHVRHGIIVTTVRDFFNCVADVGKEKEGVGLLIHFDDIFAHYRIANPEIWRWLEVVIMAGDTGE